MSVRPTPNPRRGMLRAAVTVVVLTALLIIAILVVSSLSAPSVKAPTAPPTPGPITPITTPRTTTPSTTPHAVPSPTHKKKTLGSTLKGRPAVLALERSPGLSMLERAAAWSPGGIAVRSHDRVAWFDPSGHGNPSAMLHVRFLVRGNEVAVGRADSLVKPVWSESGRFLLYVAHSRQRSPAAARWTLLQFDARNRTSSRLATLAGFAMTPLGWWRAKPLFLLANSSDTSLFTIEAGRAHFIDVLAPQVITSAALSPRAPVIAFVAPTNCYNCTLELFDLRMRDAWSGPSGIANESLVAWSNDGGHVLTMVNGRIVVEPASAGSGPEFGGAVALPKTWRHSLSVSIRGGGVRIVDRITGQSEFTDLRTRKL